MLSKEQLESRADQIRKYVEGNDWLVEEQVKAALENAEALEELLSLREQLAAINGAQEPVGFVKCDPCAEDCRWDCVDPIYLAGSVTPEGYGSDYFEVYRHPAPLKE
ncbi:hypothetical protein ACR3FV_003118 [Yersinia enterocolitica]|uniref:hypothetical protein n=1 Tax=Yersinia enterocolitica TaxID=630 RepID=UPI003D08EC3C